MEYSVKRIKDYITIASHTAIVVGVLVGAIFYIADLGASIEANKVAIEANRDEIKELRADMKAEFAQLRAEMRAESEKMDDRFEKLRDEIKEAISYTKLIESNTDKIAEIANDVKKNTEAILKK